MANEFLQSGAGGQWMNRFQSANKMIFFSLLADLNSDTANQEKTDQLVNLVATDATLREDLKKYYKAEFAETPGEKLKDETTWFEPADTTALKKSMHKITLLKARGAGYAFSDILETGKYTVDMKSFHHIRDADTTTLRSSVVQDATFKNKTTGKLNLKEIGAGATIAQLNKELEKEKLALVNQPGYEKLTYWGVATCGGHGSGYYLGPLANYVRSLNVYLLDENKEVIEKRIEPSDGITDKAAYEQKTGIGLIQDDETFYSFLVSMGCMGIVHSLIIDVQDFFVLKETREHRTWESLKATNEIRDMILDKDIHSVHIWFNPYKTKGPDGKKGIQCILSKYELPKPGEVHNGTRGWGVTTKSVDELAPLVLFVWHLIPGLLPGLLTSSLMKSINKPTVILPCYDALNFGTPNDVDVSPTNCGIPFENFEKVADELFEFLEQHRKKNPVTSPIGFRFTARSKAYLSPQYNRESCMIELPTLKGKSKKIKEMNQQTILLFNEFLMTHHEGKPHWGQILHWDILRKRYRDIFGGEYDIFLKKYKEYGRGHFSNSVTKQLGLDE